MIDSEDLYTICTNEVLREYGKPDLPWNIKAQLQGRPGPEVRIKTTTTTTTTAKTTTTTTTEEAMLIQSWRTTVCENLPRMGSTPHRP